MAEKKTGAGVRVKAGVLPEVRQIRRPDFTRKAADIEKAEAERVLLQDENAQSIQEEADAAAVAASLEAQDEDGSIDNLIPLFWEAVKNEDSKRARMFAEDIASHAERLACEAIQVAEMALKFTDTVEKGED